MAVKIPTPSARDYRHPNAKPYAERGGGKKGDQLPNFIGGVLNPGWVEWLMGWPVGWTSIEPLSPGAVVLWHGAGRDWWETDPSELEDGYRIPRTVEEKQAGRVSRIMALGNGQVPACVVLAHEVLDRWEVRHGA